MPTSITISERRAEVLVEADVVVCGAGPAGLGAALSAARTGARVVLLERYGFLGGNFTVAAVGTMCGLYLRTAPGEFDHVTGGLAREFADALMAGGSAIGPYPFKDTAVLMYVPWAAKRLADHLVTEGPGSENITLLLHSLVSDAVLDPEDGSLRAVVLATKQGPKAVVGRVFIDATGDADVAVAAGVPWRAGRPGERQFGSMQFMLQNVDVNLALEGGLGALAEAIAAHGDHLTRDGGAVIPTFRPGEVIGAMVRLARQGEPLDATDVRDLTWGEIEGRRRAEEATQFLVDHVPGFAAAFLADTATQQGVRESRHIEGRYELTGSDIEARVQFEDGIALAAWPQEYHVQGRSTEYVFLPDGTAYQIPFRSLVPRSGPANLLVAGRCISADHHALASCRVMAPCFALGEAAGTAAALMTTDSPNSVPVDLAAVDQAALRRSLTGQGAVLSY